MSFVVVDLGASGNRYSSDSCQISLMPNNMVFLQEKEDSLINPDSNDIESCLEVQIEKVGGPKCKHFPVHALIGIMAERKSGVNDRPSMNEHKHLQRINYVSAIVCTALSKEKFNLDNDIDVYLAVPPIEIHLARKEFRDTIVGNYKVTLPKYNGGTVIEFNLRDVFCCEESFMAITSYFFNLKGQPRDEAKPLFSKTVLSINIGASTTDFSIVKNGRYLDMSGRTYKIGGNEVRDYVTDEVERRYCMDLNVEDAEKAIAEGRLQQGNTYIDISDIISDAKKELAKKLIIQMQAYFKRINMDIKTINAILVSGGGSMQSQYINEKSEVVKTSEPMSFFVTEELQTWSPGTEVIHYGNDARLADLKGLLIKALLEAKKKEMQPVDAQPTSGAESNQ